MKTRLKLASIALVVTTPLAAFAQSSPLVAGSMIVSGSASLVHTTTEGSGTSTTTLSLAPSALWFVAPHLAVGGSVLLGYSSSGNNSSSNFGVGPSARFFFSESAPWLPFLSATAAPTRGSSHIGGVNVDDSGLTLDGSLGLTRMVGGEVGFTGEAFYTRRKTSQDIGSIQDVGSTSTSSNEFGIRFGVTAFIH